MNRSLQSTVLSVIGVISGVAALGGLYLNFVKPVMRWPIVVAALVLIAVAVVALLARERSAVGAEEEPVAPFESMGEPGEAHDHGSGPRVGWLLLVPFLLLGVVTPGPLGAFSAERDSGRVVTTGDDVPLFDPLPGGEDALEMPVGEYAMRALYDDARNLEGRSFTLTGFASDLASGEGWALTRMSLNCCAGDAQAIKVRVLDEAQPADNTWVRLTGRWRSPDTAVEDPATLPVVEATSVEHIPAPENPYE